MRLVVVGAGVAGLGSALSLQAAYPTCRVTLLAEKFSPSLTSDIAAGFWYPYLLGVNDPKLMLQICSDTFAYISSLVGVEGTGAMWQSGYSLEKDNDEALDQGSVDEVWKSLVRGYRKLDDTELKRFGNEYRSGSFFTTLALEGTTYLAYAMRQFLSNGGTVQQRKVSNLSDLSADFDLIVNCTGLGARELVNDKDVRPIRGQVIRMRAPSVKHFFTDGDLYCLLNRDTVILGGTHDENEWDTTPDDQVARRILEGTMKVFPELKDGIIISHQVGLRPYRTNLRLEKEMIGNETKKIPVIHNYGHGGSGLTIFWGCAQQVVRMAQPHMGAAAHL